MNSKEAFSKNNSLNVLFNAVKKIEVDIPSQKICINDFSLSADSQTGTCIEIVMGSMTV